jgi:hypothetical protein
MIVMGNFCIYLVARYAYDATFWQAAGLALCVQFALMYLDDGLRRR